MASNIMELSTEDDLNYSFFPVSNGSVEFKVKTPSNAHVALTTERKESNPMLEFFFGGWNNTKSVIRRDRTKPDKAEIETPNILSSEEFRGFWIRWDRGSISAGREGEDTPILSWEDPKPFPIAFVGVSTGWGAKGTWKIEGLIEFSTPDKSQYVFQPVLAGSLTFECRAPHNCHIALTPGPVEMDPMYEIILGGWANKQSVIRYCRKKPDKGVTVPLTDHLELLGVSLSPTLNFGSYIEAKAQLAAKKLGILTKVTVSTPRLLDPDNFKKFLIEWRKGKVTVRHGDSGKVIMEWQDFTSFGITHFGVRTVLGASGQWRINHFNNPGAS